MQQKGEHLTAQEVLNEARRKVPNLGIATVYRNLERLAALNILYKTIFDEGKYRYELADLTEHQHHHILCVECGNIFEVEEGLLDTLEEHLEKQGFEIINHQLKIFAYCADYKFEKA
jgi:Fur family ferric uptake transcriptional regulator